MSLGTQGMKSRLRDFIGTELAKNVRGIDIERDSLVESGVIDSLGIMKLVDFIEREFSLKVPDDDLVPENFETLDTIAAFLGRLAGWAPA